MINPSHQNTFIGFLKEFINVHESTNGVFTPANAAISLFLLLLLLWFATLFMSSTIASVTVTAVTIKCSGKPHSDH